MRPAYQGLLIIALASTMLLVSLYVYVTTENLFSVFPGVLSAYILTVMVAETLFSSKPSSYEPLFTRAMLCFGMAFLLTSAVGSIMATTGLGDPIRPIPDWVTALLAFFCLGFAHAASLPFGKQLVVTSVYTAVGFASIYPLTTLNTLIGHSTADGFNWLGLAVLLPALFAPSLLAKTTGRYLT